MFASQALDEDSAFIKPLINRAEAYYQTKKWEDAMNDHKKLAELDYIGKKDDTDVFVGLNRDSKQLTFWQRIAKRLFGL